MKHKHASDNLMSFIAIMSYNLQLLFILNRTIPFILTLTLEISLIDHVISFIPLTKEKCLHLARQDNLMIDNKNYYNNFS